MREFNPFAEKLNIGCIIQRIGPNKKIRLLFDEQGRYMVSSEKNNYFPTDQGELKTSDYETSVTLEKKDCGDWDWPKYTAEDMISEIVDQINERKNKKKYEKMRVFINEITKEIKLFEEKVVHLVRVCSGLTGRCKDVCLLDAPNWKEITNESEGIKIIEAFNNKDLDVDYGTGSIYSADGYTFYDSHEDCAGYEVVKTDLRRQLQFSWGLK